MIITVTKNKEVLEEDIGILYLVVFELEGKSLVKIGVTSRTIEERVSEILVSIFKKYREFPYCKPKRFRKTSNVYEKESKLHSYFKTLQYTPLKKFNGSTEFFDVPLDVAVKAYEDLLSGKTLSKSIETEHTDS
jgi:hypothetical protein